MREAFGALSTDWKQGIDWAAVRSWRLKRAHEAMKRHGLGAMLLFYDENMRYVSLDAHAGLEPPQAGPALRRPHRGQAADRLRAGRHRLPPQGPQPVDPRGEHPLLATRGSRARPVRPPSSRSTKFTNALIRDLEDAGVARQAPRRRLHRHQHDPRLREGRPDVDRRDVADDGGAGHQEPRRDQGVPDRRRRSATSLHYEFTQLPQARHDRERGRGVRLRVPLLDPGHGGRRGRHRRRPARTRGRTGATSPTASSGPASWSSSTSPR